MRPEGMFRIRNLWWSLIWVFGGLQVGSVFGDAVDPNAPARSRMLRREILESQIQPLYLSITSVSETNLESLIAEISRLKVPVSEEPKPSKPVSKEPAETTTQEEKPAEKKPSLSKAEEKQTPQTKSPEPKPSSPNTAWLKKIDTAGKPVDPLALGDALFHAGQAEPAGRFYRQVLETLTSPEESDWQWAMYQLANCLRETDPDQAEKLYQELIEKAPNSPWTAAARARREVLGWYKSRQAQTVERFLNDPNGLS